MILLAEIGLHQFQHLCLGFTIVIWGKQKTNVLEKSVPQDVKMLSQDSKIIFSDKSSIKPRGKG